MKKKVQKPEVKPESKSILEEAELLSQLQEGR